MKRGIACALRALPRNRDAWFVFSRHFIEVKGRHMVKHHPAAIAILFSSAMGLSAPAQAQCWECAQQMFEATLTTNAWYNINQDQIDQTRSADARSGLCYDANRSFSGCSGSAGTGSSGSTPSLSERVEREVMAVLDAEYRRRVTSQGQGAASQWLNRASGDMGRNIGVLNAEYRRRVGDDGRAAAGNWYEARARKLASLYVEDKLPGVGDVLIGKIPSSTRQSAEDATFEIIEPEVDRRMKSHGKAAAMEWAKTVGQAVGAGVKNLEPEYLRRAKIEGKESADAWYVEQARTLASRQVQSRN